MSREESYAEFVIALTMYVRETEGTMTDQRDAFARKLAEQPADDLLAFELESSDIAAILSASVTVDPAKADEIAMELGAGLKRALDRCAATNRMPLAAKPDHPVAMLLAGLLETPDGRKTYRNVSWMLAKATRDASVRSLVTTSDGHQATSVVIAPPPTEDEKPRPVDDGNLFDPDERFDGGDLEHE